MGAFETNGLDGYALADGAEVVVELGDDVKDAGGHGEADGARELGGEEVVLRDKDGELLFRAEGGAFIEFWEERLA